MVPFLYFFYDHPDLFGVVASPDVRVVLAHGTSLFVIVPTSVRGAVAFHRAGLVQWAAVWPIGIASIGSAFGGAHLASVLPPELLKAGFGALLIFSGSRLIVRPRTESDEAGREPRLSLVRTISTGVVVGLFSALFGVGGGTISIPLLIYLLGLPMRQVAATSIAIIGLTATAGALGYMVSGVGVEGRPPWSIGFVHLPAGLAMFLGAVVSVRWGAALNQRLKPRTLSYLFGGLFILIGLRLIGTNLAPGLFGAVAGLAWIARPDD